MASLKRTPFNRRDREVPRKQLACEHCGRSASRCGCERDSAWTAPYGWGEELQDARPPRLDREHLRSLGL